MSAQVGNRWVEQLRRVRDKPPIKIAKRLSPAAPRLKSIKKVLFPPDDEDVQCPNQICNTQLRLQQEAQQKKWNFDFAQGKPMKGAYQWKLVNGAETIETKPTPKLKQPQILDMFKKRKRVPSSTDTSEGISAKKVRMMAASSSTSPDNAPPQQQQQEASTSSAN